MGRLTQLRDATPGVRYQYFLARIPGFFTSGATGHPRWIPRKEAPVMRSHAIERLEVLITEPGRLHEILNDAEAGLRQAAMAQRCAGILVTRHNAGRYTLELSDTVPFGETWEQTLS